MNEALLILLVFSLFACRSAGDDLLEGFVSQKDLIEESADWESTLGGKYSDEGEFFSEGGRFLVHLPGKPKYGKQKINAFVGELLGHSYVLSESSDEAYMIFYLDYPMDYIESLGQKVLLDSALVNALRPVEADTTEFLRYFDIGPDHALEFKAHGPNVYMIGRVYLIQGRMYRVGMIKTNGYPSEVLAKKFLDSFHPSL